MAVAIILMGFELGKSSVMKIIHPETVNYTLLSAAVLLFSVAVKLFMFFFLQRNFKGNFITGT